MAGLRLGLGRWLNWAWGQWWLVTALWWLCAVVTVASAKGETHKCMLAVLANLVVGFPLTAPPALRYDLGPLRTHWRPVLLIAVLSGLERNLTNSSMYSIGGSLKTALHGFNVILTFFASALIGVNQRGRQCLLHGRCCENIMLVVALGLVTGGGVVTALCQDKSWKGSSIGILLQLASSLAYAAKFSVVKLLLSRDEGGLLGSAGAALPTKFQITFVTNPVIGLIALGFLPFFEDSWALPPWQTVFVVAFAATGIMVFELRLTELTSPVTVSVLATLHNVAIVLYFLVFFQEELSVAQLAGFGVSSVGAVMYAWAKHSEPHTVVTDTDHRTAALNDSFVAGPVREPRSSLGVNGM